MIRNLWFITSCCLSYLCCAENADAQVYHVRFLKQDCRGNYCQYLEEGGSSVCLGELESGEWLLVSVAHGAEQALRVDVAIPDAEGHGHWQTAQVMAKSHDEMQDLALLKVKTSQRLRYYPLNTDQQDAGIQVELAGYPITGFRRWKSRLKSANTVSGMNQQGESGGPVLFQNSVIGIQWGHSPQEQATYFTPARYIKTMVEQHARMKVVERGKSDAAVINIGNQEFQQSRCDCAECREKMMQLNQQFSQLKSRNQELEERISRLEPLLKRRVILETEQGEITADRVYAPHEAIRLRSIYRSQVNKDGNNK